MGLVPGIKTTGLVRGKGQVKKEMLFHKSPYEIARYIPFESFVDKQQSCNSFRTQRKQWAAYQLRQKFGKNNILTKHFRCMYGSNEIKVL